LAIGQGDRCLVVAIKREQHHERTVVVRTGVEQQRCAIEDDAPTDRVAGDGLTECGCQLCMSAVQIKPLRELDRTGERGTACEFRHDECAIDGEGDGGEVGEGGCEGLHGMGVARCAQS